MNSQFQHIEGECDGLWSVSPKIRSAGGWPRGDENPGQDGVSREVEKRYHLFQFYAV